MFVHLTLESRLSRLRRSGIASFRPQKGEVPRAVYAVPVTPNFYASHQWLRELKRKKGSALAGIYFRIPDDEAVWVGHYGQQHRRVTAAEAVAIFLTATDPLGWEVLIPRRIDATEIHSVRRLPQVIGWRFFPAAKGKPPFCTCKFCTTGEYGSEKMRKRLGSPDD